MISTCSKSNLTSKEKRLVSIIESRVHDISLKFNRSPYSNSPNVVVVRSPDQFIEEFDMIWRRITSLNPTPSESNDGYTGMMIGVAEVEDSSNSKLLFSCDQDTRWLDSTLNIYVSVIGDRANHFIEIYAHERTHSFFPPGYGHNGQFPDIEMALLRGIPPVCGFCGISCGRFE